MNNKLWSGRFKEQTDPLMEKFSASLLFDQKLFDADIAVNKSWARALVQPGIYTTEEADKVCTALDEIQQDYHAGLLTFPDVEDIHSATELWLTERTGDVGARIHTGRSRNDQVVTDLRLYISKESRALVNALTALATLLVEKAEMYVETVFPGQTHVRQAQPISFAHYLMALVFQLLRDRDRMYQSLQRCNSLPLGSGAIAGAAFDIDRQALAVSLGFDSVLENSYDATSDRDIVNEVLYICAQIMLHLSRVAEDFIFWSSEAYQFIGIHPTYATGSSMMPQKRNPDSLELIRGKTARVIGNQVTGLTLLKGIPTAYVRDLQEDKLPLFDSLEQTVSSVQIFEGVIRTLEVHADNMLLSLELDLYATDLADYLVRKGMPFRQAHSLVGKIVMQAEDTYKTLEELSLEDYKTHSDLFEKDLFELFDPLLSLQKRNITGGTGPLSVEKQIQCAKDRLDHH